MNQYPAYKPSRTEWIGNIPSHWEAIALKHLVEVKITDGPHETPEFIEEGVPFVSAEAVKNGKIDFNFKRGYISSELDKLYSLKCKPKRGDIFIVKSGSTTGKVAIVDFDDNFNIWSPLALIRSKSEYNTYYFYHALSSDYFQKSIQLFWSFGTQPNIGMNVLENLRVAVPPIDEQTAIARYLDEKTAQLDTLIDRKQRLIDLLREEKAALINEAVTKGIDPNVPTKSSGIDWLGDIPAHWEVKKLKRELDIFDYIRVPLSSDERGKLEKVYDYYGASGVIDKVDNFLFDGEYILIGEDGANLVTRNIPLAFKATGKFWVNNHAHILKPKKGLVDYYVHQLECWDYTIYITGSAQPKLTAENLGDVDVIVPPLDEQAIIVDYLNKETAKIDHTISRIEQEIKLMKEYRIALISEVVTGKVKVV